MLVSLTVPTSANLTSFFLSQCGIYENPPVCQLLSNTFIYISQYQADIVRYHMRKDLREASGLGSPPAQFTTNGSESINAALKRKVNHQESDWPQLVNVFVESQEEIVRDLSGCGQYCLNPEFAHYDVSTQK